MRVKWWKKARADLLDIVSAIQTESPLAATAFLDKIDRKVGCLAQFARIGRHGRVATTHELVITGTPYIVIYKVFSDWVAVTRVLHGKRRWPAR